MLWKKIMPRLSAGRVQSVATRLVVERERARTAFVAAEYWDIEGTFSPGPFKARLVALDGKRVAQGRDFSSQGVLGEGAVQLDEPTAKRLADALEAPEFVVRSVEQKPYTRRPAAPFMTSTLQQEASRKLRLGSQTTMRIAQRLYENGYITYMRTDSTTLAESALTAARDQARELYGAEYVPDKPRRYDRKVKNAQEAHEAIRPAGDSFRTPQQVKGELSRDEHALYDLIWKRTIASQMKDAAGSTVSVRLGARRVDRRGRRVRRGRDDDHVPRLPARLRGGARRGRPPTTARTRRRSCPRSREGDPLDATELEPQGHSTSPPARYTEASLVRALEERGIGRPSTYASIIGTIHDRGYVFKRGTALVPSFLAFSVVALLEQHFGKLVDYDFTARMEDDLDRIAEGDEQRVEWLGRFYFGGDGDEGLRDLVTHQLAEIDARDINSIPIGNDITLRIGRYGPYLERDDKRVSVPDNLPPDELTVELAEELLAKPSGDRELGVNPETGRTIVAREGRYGPYVAELPPEGSDEKPRTASLFDSMSLETVTLEEALRLLSLPRVVGEADGEEVTAQNGRYGPYVQKGKETRSLPSEEALFTITFEEAARAARPSRRSAAGRGQAAGPLREIGPDPGDRQADRRPRGPFRPVRHRRRDEREPAARRRPRDGDDGTRDRAARRPAGAQARQAAP